MRELCGTLRRACIKHNSIESWWKEKIILFETEISYPVFGHFFAFFFLSTCNNAEDGDGFNHHTHTQGIRQKFLVSWKRKISHMTRQQQ